MPPVKKSLQLPDKVQIIAVDPVANTVTASLTGHGLPDATMTISVADPPAWTVGEVVDLSVLPVAWQPTVKEVGRRQGQGGGNGNGNGGGP